MEDPGRSSIFFTDSMGIPEHHNSKPRPRPIPRPTSRIRLTCVEEPIVENAIPAQIVVIVHGFYWKENHYKY